MKKEAPEEVVRERDRFIQMMDPSSLPEYAHKICNEISTQIDLTRFAMSMAAVTAMIARHETDPKAKIEAEKLHEVTTKAMFDFCDSVIMFRIHKDKLNPPLERLIKSMNEGKN